MAKKRDNPTTEAELFARLTTAQLLALASQVERNLSKTGLLLRPVLRQKLERVRGEIERRANETEE